MDTPARTQIVKAAARSVGFDRVGICQARPLPGIEHYKAWLAAGHAGEMHFMQRHVELRGDPSSLLAGARSVVCVALNYGRRNEPGARGHGSGSKDKRSRTSGQFDALSDRCASPAQGGSLTPRDSQPGPTGYVAQYARGADYHVVMRRMLDELTRRLRAEMDMPFEARPCVDTAPVLERELAALAGVGWIGKNTMLLHHELGTFFFLGELITTLELTPDEPLPDHCGTCTRCIEACPTQAIIAPRELDARRCISYFTIEHRGEIPAEFHTAIGDHLYGCDICQDVCPFNSKAPVGTQPEIMAERIAARLPLKQLTELRSSDYKRLTSGTAARRATREMWRRNAELAAANSRSPATRSALRADD